MSAFCKSLVDYSLYFVTSSNFLKNPNCLKNIEGIIESGVTAIQIREKNITTREYIERAKDVHEIAQSYHVPVIVNDRVDVAFESGVDGVHVGVDDLSVTEARKILGEDKIVGATASSFESAISSITESADYIGTDSIFFSETKSGVQKGLHWLEDLKKSVDDFLQCDFPVVAIGGIDQSNIGEVLLTGVGCVAVCSSIAGSEDPFESTRTLRFELDSNIHGSLGAEIVEGCCNALLEIRRKQPIVYNTNYVVLNHSVNKALGGTTLLTNVIREAKEVVSMCDSVCLNPGILSERWVELMELTGKNAVRMSKPVVLDTHGAHISEFRRTLHERLLEIIEVNVMKGKAVDLSVLSGSEKEYADYSELARTISEKYECIGAVTNIFENWISNGEVTVEYSIEQEYLKNIAGKSSLLTAIIGGFLGSEEDEFLATLTALFVMCACCELSNQKLGPMVFQSDFINNIEKLSPSLLRRSVNKKPLIIYE